MNARQPAGSGAVGIDLGTTNSVLAYLDADGVPTSLVNFEGHVTTPSKVLIDGPQVLVGAEAIKAAVQHSENYAELFKRYMGEDKFPRSVAGRSFRPEELSALVLKRLQQDAKRRLGTVGSAVITVPAYFDECRRRATYSAAGIAGWEVLDLINEPTAAALAFAHRIGKRPPDHDEKEYVLVFDLGGGTLDATVLEIHRGREYRTIATDGEVQLGGHDWDSRLRDHLAELFRKQTSYDPLGTLRGQTEFLQLAERVKRTLSDKETAQVPCSHAGRQAVLKVDRKTFEGLTAELVLRCRQMAELVLDQAGRKWGEVHTVLAVGGSTRMPMVRRMLQELWGKAPDQSLSVDEAIAHGAAIYASLKGSASSVRVVNVNSHSYRVLAKRTDGTVFAKSLIPKNSPLPAAHSYLFTASSGASGASKIEVVEGEEEDPHFCTRIGKVVVDGLNLSGDKKWLVQVKLRCREDGELEVAAAVRDPADASKVVKQVRATLEPAHGMSREQVAGARQWIESLTVS
jgi:molecular chaperone DnaK